MKTNIVVLGGGTGVSTVLLGLKKRPNILLTAIVSVADNGGSSGRLRNEHSVLPYGDILQCLVALSRHDENLRLLFKHRFDKGRQNGDTVGNLLLTAAQEEYGDVLTAVRKMQELLRVRGQVIPVSSTAAQLCAVLNDSTVITGEDNIDAAKSSRSPIDYCFIEDPDTVASYEALEAIRRADILICGPGDLYTSTLPVLITGGVRSAVFDSQAKLVYIMNLMTRRGQTEHFAASDFLRVASKSLGRRFDAVLLNSTAIPEEAIRRYAESKEQPVQDDLKGQDTIRADLLSTVFYEQGEADAVKRSLVRHDPEKISKVICEKII